MRKRWLIVPMIVMVLAVALVGGVVLAAGDSVRDGNDVYSKGEGFASRVAEILGLEEDTVADAMKQASEEIHNERIEAWLDKMVESGKVTQEQADEYQEWLNDQPTGFERSWGRGFGRHHGFRGKGRWSKSSWDKDYSDSSESST